MGLARAGVAQEGPATLTCHVGAGAVVGSVLQQPVVAGQLPWFAVLRPGQRRALGRAVGSGIVVELEAFTLWSGFS